MDKQLMNDIAKCQNTEQTIKALDEMSEVDAWYHLRALKNVDSDAYSAFCDTTLPEKAIFHKVLKYMMEDSSLDVLNARARKYIQYGGATNDPEVAEIIIPMENYYKEILN